MASSKRLSTGSTKASPARTKKSPSKATIVENTSPILTDSSHTLSGDVMATPVSSTSPDNALLTTLRPENRHGFIQPNDKIAGDALKVVKDTLEGFASTVGEEQQRRLDESRKRKRGGDGIEVLKMRKVHMDGFETGQVWEQARRIIEGVVRFSEEVVEGLEEGGELVGSDAEEDSNLEDPEEFEGLSQEEEGDDEELSGEDLELGSDEELVDEDGVDDSELFQGVDEDDLVEEENEEEEDGDDDDDENEYEEDPHGLNDGFFSIDEFNRQTQWFEDQDARGDPNTDHVSDEEDIDWDADPNAIKPKAKDGKKAKKQEEAEEEEEEGGEDIEEDDEEDDGPGFGNMDLDAPEGASDDEDFEAPTNDDNDDDGANANGVMYKDFFAPPPKKRDNNKPRKPRAPAKPADYDDIERAENDVKRDLFEDDDSDMDLSEDALSDVEAGDIKARRSTHERRQAKLADEIRKLEAESVKKKEWTLGGEASAVDRPLNSALEQDIDFEHVGKPIPFITPEITESIEELVKRRILAQDTNEILRRRPDSDAPATQRRGLAEVSDQKNEKGLADVYEEDHMREQNPEGHQTKEAKELEKEEKEIESMWKDICGKLDALSSWHYKPKPSAPSLEVVGDVATVAMEDAQPATSMGVSGSDSRLAPQEIYKSGEKGEGEKGERVTKGGAPISKEEMSREDKKRARRREKERGRKGEMGKRKPLGGRDQTMEDLKKGGVKVINKRGEMVDVEGNAIKGNKTMASGGYKL